MPGPYPGRPPLIVAIGAAPPARRGFFGGKQLTPDVATSRHAKRMGCRRQTHTQLLTPSKTRAVCFECAHSFAKRSPQPERRWPAETPTEHAPVETLHTSSGAARAVVHHFANECARSKRTALAFEGVSNCVRVRCRHPIHSACRLPTMQHLPRYLSALQRAGARELWSVVLQTDAGNRSALLFSSKLVRVLRVHMVGIPSVRRADMSAQMSRSSPAAVMPASTPNGRDAGDEHTQDPHQL